MAEEGAYSVVLELLTVLLDARHELLQSYSSRTSRTFTRILRILLSESLGLLEIRVDLLLSKVNPSSE